MDKEEFLIVRRSRIKKIKENQELLEKSLEVKIKIGPRAEVTITGDGMECWDAKNVLKAISEGFIIDRAMLLKNEKYVMESIEIEDFAKKRDDEKRILARAIGRDGSARRKIEEFTDCFIKINEKTINIVGEYEDVMDAKEGFIKLLDGATHSAVFRFLEKKIRDKRIKRII